MGNRTSGFGRGIGGAQLAVALLVIVLAAGVAIHSIETPPQPVYKSNPQASPYGYTWSLILFALPCLMMVLWYWANRNDPQFPYHTRAATITGSIVLSGYFLLDILFANVFFLYPNPDAVLGIRVWGWDFKTERWLRNIPIEEFFFWGLGFMVILLCYGWSSRTLFRRYMHAGRAYKRAARKFGGVVQYSFLPFVLGAAFFLLGLAYKKMGPSPEGFPGYFLFLTALIVIPSSIFYQTIRRLMNLQALTFTVLTLLPMCILWEVTLALPYGWWNYQHHAMLGLYIRPWSNLPIEEPLLWISASWLDVTLFEFIRLYLAQDRPWREFLFGSRQPAPAGSGSPEPGT